MKTRRIISVAAMLLLVFSLAACGKVSAVVKINDRGVVTEIETKLPDTVENILGQAELTLGDGDEVSPALDEELSEAGEIVISRKNTVTLTVDGESREVVVIGGTVGDLFKQEGITLADNQHADHDEGEYLTDGMEITVTTEYSVTVLHDGTTDEVTMEAGTVADALAACGTELGEDDRIEPAVDTEISDGMEIVISRVTFGEETETEEIGFETVREDDPATKKGVEWTKTEGEKGEKTITYKVTYVDGEEESREKTGEEITKEPVNEVICVGTKEKKEQQSSGSSKDKNTEGSSGSGSESEESGNGSEGESSGGVTEVSRVAVPNCDDGSHGYYEIQWSDGSTTYEEY